MHTRRRRPDYLQACPTGPPVDGDKSALTPALWPCAALWPCTFCSDPHRIPDAAALCALSSVHTPHRRDTRKWSDDYRTRTRTRLVQRIRIFWWRHKGVCGGGWTLCCLESVDSMKTVVLYYFMVYLVHILWPVPCCTTSWSVNQLSINISDCLTLCTT